MLAALLGLSWPVGARADEVTEAVTAVDLDRWADALGNDDADARTEALSRLTLLGPEALSAIDDRIAHLRDLERFDTEETSRAVAKIRHTTGSRHPEEDVDIVQGILPRLAETRDPITVRMAERLCLLRSLEAQRSIEAGRRLLDLLGLHFTPLKWEARRIVRRMGVRALPMVIEARGHRIRNVRRWSEWAERELGVDGPGSAVVAVRNQDPHLLAALLRAYASVKDMDAMAVIVAFVGDRRRVVRTAARDAMAQYGRNGIWQLRRAYRIHVGEDATLSWGWKTTANKLYGAIDAERLAPAVDALESGLKALQAGDLRTMERHYDEVMERAPELERRREMAPGWARLAEALSAKNDIQGARHALVRAVFLDPEHPAAASWRAQLTFLQAEESLARGVVDLDAYRHVLTLDPEHGAAAGRIDVLTGGPEERQRQRHRWALGGVVAVLALLALVLFHRRREHGAPEPIETDSEVDDALPGTMPPDTLPG